MLSVVSAHWGLGSRLLADVFLPDASAEELEIFARFQRAAAPPETAAAHLGFVYSVDVAAELAQIDAPTLVLHRREDRAIPFELGRELAASRFRTPVWSCWRAASTCPGAATPPRSPPP